MVRPEMSTHPSGVASEYLKGEVLRCAKEGCEEKPPRGQKYCSRECAPLGRFGLNRESPIQSEKTGRSSSRDTGELSPPPSRSAKARTLSTLIAIGQTQTIASESARRIEDGSARTPSVRTNGEDRSMNSSQPMKSENFPEGESNASEETQIESVNSGSGTGGTVTSISRPSMTGEIEDTQTESSGERLMTFEAEKLASVSLVDDVISRLHWQMKRLTLRGSDQLDDADLYTKTEIRRAKMVTDTASSIAKMVKLKIDAVKVFNEIKKGEGT